MSWNLDFFDDSISPEIINLVVCMLLRMSLDSPKVIGIGSWVVIIGFVRLWIIVNGFWLLGYMMRLWGGITFNGWV